MQLKLIMSWDIYQDKEQDYLDFLVGKMIPQMSQLGFELSDAWATVYGESPQVQLAAILPDELEAERRMSQPEWTSLIEELQEHIDNFSYKLVPNSGKFQF